MRHALTLHQDSRCDAVATIDVEVARQAGRLALHYRVTGRIDALALPRAGVPERADELWRHSCFEAFLRAPPHAPYVEVNCAPSLQWAAYRFDDYRVGGTVANDLPPPSLEARSGDTEYALRVLLDVQHLREAPPRASWRLGLSAVIEEISGRTSYWALAHPPGRADFHHADCFALELPAASAP